MVKVNGFVEEGVHAYIEAFLLEVVRVIGCEGSYEHFTLTIELTKLSCCLETIHYRHVAVHEDEFVVLTVSWTDARSRLRSLGSFSHSLNGFLAVIGFVCNNVELAL